MEVVKLVDDTSKRQYAGHIPSQISASGANAESIPSKAFHFGLLDVPLLEVFPSPTDAANYKEGSMPVHDKSHTKVRSSGAGAAKGTVYNDGGRTRGRTMAPPDRRQSRNNLPSQEEPPVSRQYKKPIRPTAMSLMQSGDSGGRSPGQRTTGASMGVEVSKLEGSATSDEHYETSQSRLIPRRGAGPELRNGDGGKIDEYLMRLLRAGLAQADAPLSQQGPSQRHPSAWQGSRLGPLAPGAGVKSSSVRMARLAANPAAPAHPSVSDGRLLSEQEQTGQQPMPPPASQPAPSAAKFSKDDRSLSVRRQNERIVHPVGHKFNDEDPVAAARDSLGHACKAWTPDCEQTILSHQMKSVLGELHWQHIQDRIRRQAQEFDLQLKELHRLVDVQTRLHHCSSAATRPVSADSHSSWQHTSFNGQSYSGLQPESQQCKSAWWLNSGAWDPSMAIGLATWQPHASEAAEASQRKPCPPKADQALSRTTRIALDAQRARRGNKNRVRWPSKAEENSQPSDEKDRPFERTGILGHGIFTERGSMQDQSNWLDRLQPLAQQDAFPPTGPDLKTGAAPQSLDPLIGWYHYHFNQASTQSSTPDQHPPAKRAMQFAGLSLASPDVGWEDQCQDFFNYSMTGTSDVNTAGQSSLQIAQRAQGLPRLARPSSKANDLRASENP